MPKRYWFQAMLATFCNHVLNSPSMGYARKHEFSIFSWWLYSARMSHPFHSCPYLSMFDMFPPCIIRRLAIDNRSTGRTVACIDYVIRRKKTNYSEICWCPIYRERRDNGRGEAVDCTRVTRELVRLINQDEARLRVIAYTHAQGVHFEHSANGVFFILPFGAKGQSD